MTGAGHTAGEWIARSDRTIAENGVPLLRFYAGRNEHQNAREAVASVNSYRRHFGPHAVSAAEGDLLGLALEALRDAADEIRALREWIDTFPSKAIAPDDWAKLHKPLVTKNTLKNISTILSQAQAREVRSS